MTDTKQIEAGSAGERKFATRCSECIAAIDSEVWT